MGGGREEGKGIVGLGKPRGKGRRIGRGRERGDRGVVRWRREGREGGV